MVNIDSIREYMRSQADEDRKRKWIQVEGEDLDDALRQAAIELGLSVKKLEYEIRDPGKKGSFGFGKHKCVIIAYPIVLETDEDMEDDGFDLNLSRIDERQVDKDGDNGYPRTCQRQNLGHLQFAVDHGGGYILCS